MYKYHLPTPIVINLAGKEGYELREKTAKFIEENLNVSGAERGSRDEQGFGALAEVVVRKHLGFPEINPKDHPFGYDILLPSKVKLDVKCRGGNLAFQEEYIGADNLPREAKHNLFARQVYETSLDTDIYLMTHLETPKDKTLPGTSRQRKWTLYVCGWVSKKRVKREGVYLPRGSLTERGRSWFAYRGQEIEFYNKNLNGIRHIKDLLEIERRDVKKDEKHKGDLNLTSIDAIRIAYDLVGRGILGKTAIQTVKKITNIDQDIKPLLHPNQYHHLVEWLEENKKIGKKEAQKLARFFPKEGYEGI